MTSILDSNYELVGTLKGMEVSARNAIAKLLEAQNLNASLQGDRLYGSPQWQEHEKIDDCITAALQLLGH